MFCGCMSLSVSAMMDWQPDQTEASVSHCGSTLYPTTLNKLWLIWSLFDGLFPIFMHNRLIVCLFVFYLIIVI